MGGYQACIYACGARRALQCMVQSLHEHSCKHAQRMQLEGCGQIESIHLWFVCRRFVQSDLCGPEWLKYRKSLKRHNKPWLFLSISQGRRNNVKAIAMLGLVVMMHTVVCSKFAFYSHADQELIVAVSFTIGCFPESWHHLNTLEACSFISR
jgi:Ni,Fe-hydrogenase I cytochrome b subunit